MAKTVKMAATKAKRVCTGCGKEKELRMGFCFSCVSKAEAAAKAKKKKKS